MINSVYKEDTKIIQLGPDERIDDLQFKGMRIIQSSNSFRFGTDSVLLAGFARVFAKENCIDIGSGSGVLSILIHARTGCRMTAVDIDEEQCKRLKKSVLLNGISDSISVINTDYILNVDGIGRGKYDVAVCNPPYFRYDSGKISEKSGATHEVNANIFNIAHAASNLLKFGGKLFICFPAQRLSELICALVAARIEPKKLRLVSSNVKSKPFLTLVEAKKGAKPGLIIENNLIIYDENGNHTEEVREIYHEQ